MTGSEVAAVAIARGMLGSSAHALADLVGSGAVAGLLESLAAEHRAIAGFVDAMGDSEREDE